MKHIIIDGNIALNEAIKLTDLELFYFKEIFTQF